MSASYIRGSNLHLTNVGRDMGLQGKRHPNTKFLCLSEPHSNRSKVHARALVVKSVITAVSARLAFRAHSVCCLGMKDLNLER